MDLDRVCMVSGRNGGVPLTFRGGGVGVIAGGRGESGWGRQRAGAHQVVKLSDHAGAHRGVCTHLLSLWSLEQAVGAITVRHFVNILGCEFDWIGGKSSQVCAWVR